jgi:hypothetical protein
MPKRLGAFALCCCSGSSPHADHESRTCTAMQVAALARKQRDGAENQHQRTGDDMQFTHGSTDQRVHTNAHQGQVDADQQSSTANQQKNRHKPQNCTAQMLTEPVARLPPDEFQDQ